MPITSKSKLGETMPTPIGFVLTSNLLVTVRYAELHAIPSTLETLKKQVAPRSVDIFATLIESMVDYSADVLEEIAAKLNAVSKQVFNRNRDRNNTWSNRELKETLVEVGEAGDHLSHIQL